MLIWIVHPAGEQCANGPIYPDSEFAATALESAGVLINEIETISLNVCQACGCPISEHFRAQIDASDISKAEALGWRRE
jgi:hypothetical protein